MLKKCSLYPVNDCIELCNQCQVFDALIYLYRKAGFKDKALEVIIKIIQNNYNKILENLISIDFDKNLYEKSLGDFAKAFSDIVNFLEEDKSFNNEENNMWFIFFLYFNDKCNRISRIF